MELRILLLSLFLFWVGVFQVSVWLLTYVTVAQFCLLVSILLFAYAWFLLDQIDRAFERTDEER